MRDPQSPILTALYHRKYDDAEALAAAAPQLTVWEAAALGRDDELRRLLAADPARANDAGADGHEPLGLAAFFGRLEAMRVLLAAGADPRATPVNEMRVQPLHAAVAARSLEAVALLLEHGADVNARQQLGYTPLMGAAASGRQDIADLLLAHGADPALVSEDGESAADVAAEHQHAALAAHLANRGEGRRGSVPVTSASAE